MNDPREELQHINDLLRARDLDTQQEGTPEVVRILVLYAHLGAWLMQGLTQRPLVGEKAPPELLELLNSKPHVDRYLALLRNYDDVTRSVMEGILAETLTLFDRTEGPSSLAH